MATAKSTKPFRYFDSSPEVIGSKRIQKMRAVTHWCRHSSLGYISPAEAERRAA